MRKVFKFILNRSPLFFVILLGLVPIFWFYQHGGQIINGVDTNFPLNPLLWWQKRFFIWNDDLNAGINFSSSVAGLFFHLIQTTPYVLGINLQYVQILSLVFWFSVITLSSYYFIKSILPNSKLAQLVFVLLYSVNIYMFNSWENVKVANLSLIAALPFFLGIITNLKYGKISLKLALLYSAICSFILSGAGINPAYFLNFFIISGIYTAVVTHAGLNRKQFILDARNFILLSLVVVCIGAYWVLPSANFILSSVNPTGSIDKIGYTNWVDSLSENTSLLNIIRMRGAWDWYAIDGTTGAPLYIPYALNYFYRMPFILFSFLVPGLVILSLLLMDKQKKGLYTAFALMFAIGIFLGVGTHLPTGDLFRVFLNNVPFFSLFRSPWYIFTPLVTISIAGLIALLIDNLFRISPKNLKYSALILSCVVIFIGGYLLYSYPLITGKIFRPASNDGFYITFPQYVFDTGKWLNQADNIERILVYPDDEIEKFDWKYRSVESILQLVSNKEFIYSPLNASDSPVAKTAKELYVSLKRGQIEQAKNLASKLNINSIFEKEDQSSLSSQLPKEVKTDLIKNIGSWNFYKFPQGKVNEKIFFPKSILLGTGDINIDTRILGITDPNTILLNPEDTEVKKISDIGNITKQAMLASNSQNQDYNNFISSESTLKGRLQKRDMTKSIFKIEVPSEGSYTPILERYKLEDFGIDPNQDLEVILNNQPTKLFIDKLNDSFVYYKPITLKNGFNNIEIKLTNNTLVAGGDFSGDLSYKESAEGEFKVLGDSTEGDVLSIWNNYTKDTSAVFTVPKFDPYGAYMVQLKYKQIYGNNASVITAQRNTQTLIKVQVERMPNYPEWNYFSYYYQPVLTESSLDIGLIAPETKDPLGTKVLYDDLQVYKVFTNSLFFVKNESTPPPPSVNIIYSKKSPVSYEGSVEDGGTGHFIVFSENYSKDWNIEILDSNDKKINLNPIHFSANSYANAWYVEGAPKKYQFRITYKPQSLFYWGLIISGIVLALIIILNVDKLYKYIRKYYVK